jgi:hypothetical protein
MSLAAWSSYVFSALWAVFFIYVVDPLLVLVYSAAGVRYCSAASLAAASNKEYHWHECRCHYYPIRGIHRISEYDYVVLDPYV